MRKQQLEQLTLKLEQLVLLAQQRCLLRGELIKRRYELTVTVKQALPLGLRHPPLTIGDQR